MQLSEIMEADFRRLTAEEQGIREMVEEGRTQGRIQGEASGYSKGKAESDADKNGRIADAVMRRMESDGITAEEALDIFGFDEELREEVLAVIRDRTRSPL